MGEKLRMWIELVSLVLNVSLGEAEDKREWSLGKSKLFSVKSMYMDLLIANHTPENCLCRS